MLGGRYFFPRNRQLAVEPSAARDADSQKSPRTPFPAAGSVHPIKPGAKPPPPATPSQSSLSSKASSPSSALSSPPSSARSPSSPPSAPSDKKRSPVSKLKQKELSELLDIFVGKNFESLEPFEVALLYGANLLEPYLDLFIDDEHKKAAEKQKEDPNAYARGLFAKKSLYTYSQSASEQKIMTNAKVPERLRQLAAKQPSAASTKKGGLGAAR